MGAREISPERLERRFADKKPPLSPTEADLEATRCLYCYDAPCIRSCPTSIGMRHDSPRKRGFKVWTRVRR